MAARMGSFFCNVMKSIFLVLLIVLAIVLVCFAGLGIKIIVKKNGEFKRHCSSIDPYTGEQKGCVCASRLDDKCSERKKHPYQPLDVNRELMKEIE